MMFGRGFYGGNAMGYGFDHFGTYGLWHFGMMAVFLVGIIVLVLWLMKRNKKSVGDQALAILRERYAKGEINEEEYNSKRIVLK
ncbi:SHOCT domain-containing protein [Fusibacter bizertensis]